jgi:hypothetical protein
MLSNTFYKCIALTKRCKLNNSRSHLPNYDYNERRTGRREDQRNLITTRITYFYKNILHSAHITYLCVICKTNSNYFAEQH